MMAKPNAKSFQIFKTPILGVRMRASRSAAAVAAPPSPPAFLLLFQFSEKIAEQSRNPKKIDLFVRTPPHERYRQFSGNCSAEKALSPLRRVDDFSNFLSLPHIFVHFSFRSSSVASDRSLIRRLFDKRPLFQRHQFLVLLDSIWINNELHLGVEIGVARSTSPEHSDLFRSSLRKSVSVVE